MGNRAIDLRNSGKTVLLAFEESIGYMCGTKVLDKDGISASVILAEMAVYLHKNEKRTLAEKLDWIYEQ
jgi:phosphomannomutase